MAIISPSLFAADPLNLKFTIEQCQEVGINNFHIDIMDIGYVNNIGLNINLCNVLSTYDLTLNIHIMTQHPEQVVKLISMDKHIYSIAFHPKTTNHPEHLIRQIQKHGIKAGIAINPNESLDDSLIDICDYYLLMGVEPGKSGQEIIPDFKTRVQDLMKKIDQSRQCIHVDGGINKDKVLELKSCSIDLFVVGSALFKNDAIQKNIHQIQNALVPME